ncbi:MAG: ABC transporter permease [Chloroflexi bacterium]|nr:ABC transporter permease [Chloroflexota bacterium]|tara:strand:+ start:143 stop:985 length:843 start_codon:yes stop_codon:yes gene_type:complete
MFRLISKKIWLRFGLLENDYFSKISNLIYPLIALISLIIVWEIVVHFFVLKSYIMPPPSSVFKELFFGGNVVDSGIDYYLNHAFITLLEAVSGFLIGSVFAFFLASIMVHSNIMDRTIYPLAVLIKVTPLVAIVPLFVIWFGFGLVPKILIAALITFFPVMINSLIGFRSVNPEMLDLFHSVAASNWKIFRRVRIPNSLPYIFAALRIAAPLSVIGAIVGEWFTGNTGLGAVIVVAHNNLEMPKVFAAVIMLAFIGIGLTACIIILEKYFVFWNGRGAND